MNKKTKKGGSSLAVVTVRGDFQCIRYCLVTSERSVASLFTGNI